MGSLLPGGWDELMATNHALAIAARHVLCETLQIPPPCPDGMLGAMAVVPLPDGKPMEVARCLARALPIEVPIVPFSDRF
jgi:isopenicillin-N epimerase